jgi:Ca-activated chloride channel family protein
MRTERQTDIPLRSVSVRGRVRGLLFELSVEQSYENASSRNVEAVYTFPVPLRAVLLGLDMRIGDRELTAVAARKEAAAAEYEQAVEEGHTAALLERSGDGLYTLSVGNLMAGERAVIRYRYAELLDRSGDYVRLRIPTVIAPRYGKPDAHGVAPHQRPEVDLTVEYPFEVSIDLEGEIANAAVACLSHAVTVARTETGTRLGLAKGATLDRDFILEMSGSATRAQAVVARDDGQYVAIASLAPEMARAPARPVALNVVLDCSGSMQGDSIAAAKRALLAVMNRLTSEDRLSVARFGDEYELVTKGFQPIESAMIEKLSHKIRGIDADMGGTEMAKAITAALAVRGSLNAQRDLMLITDGEVWAIEEVVDLVAESGYRLFVVAVGAAPNEALARKLAERTGGACEFVSPNEDAEAVIVRMFKRMREAPRSISRVEWPAAPLWEVARPTAVFSSDVVHLVAAFRERPEGAIRMTVQAADGSIVDSTCGLTGEVLDWDAVPRLGIARRIESLEDEEAAELAERHQIGSRHTSFVLVHRRAEGERAEALPELKSVRQMLAAGWGGTGTTVNAVMGAKYCRAMPTREPSPRALSLPSGQRMSSRSYNLPARAPADLSACMERIKSEPIRSEQSPEGVLTALLEELDRGGSLPNSYEKLEKLGVPRYVVEQLWSVGEREGFLEARVVRVFIALLVERYADQIDRPEVLDIVSDTFRRGAHGVLREILEPMLAWRV